MNEEQIKKIEDYLDGLDAAALTPEDKSAADSIRDKFNDMAANGATYEDFSREMNRTENKASVKPVVDAPQITDVRVSAHPDSAGYWRNLSDSQLLGAADASSSYNVRDTAGGVDSTEFNRFKDDLAKETDRIEYLNDLNGRWWNNPVTRAISPRQFEDLYAGHDPTNKSFILDLVGAGINSVPFAMPFGAAATTLRAGSAIGKLLGGALEYVGANAAAPALEEAMDAIAYKDAVKQGELEHAERSQYSLGDVFMGTAVNLGMPVVLKGAGAKIAKYLPEKWSGIKNYISNFGGDPASAAFEAKARQKAVVDNFEKFNPASSTNIAKQNEVINFHREVSGDNSIKPYDDPLTVRGEDANYYVPEKGNEPVYNTDVKVPTIEEAQKAYDMLETLGAMESGDVKLYVDKATKEITLGPDIDRVLENKDFKFVSPEGEPVYDFSKHRSRLPEMKKEGVVPVPSMGERLASTIPSSFIVNKIGRQRAADKLLGAVDPSYWAVEDADEGYVKQGIEAMNNARDEDIIDEIIEENKDMWAVGFRPWSGIYGDTPPDDMKDKLEVRAWQKWRKRK